VVDDDCPLCHGARVVGANVAMPDEPYAELADIPCRCTYRAPEPQRPVTPIEEFLQ
jgi:hypothetical protein